MSRIQMTPTVRLVLFFLRVYLIFLLFLIILKFARIFSGTEHSSSPDGNTTIKAKP